MGELTATCPELAPAGWYQYVAYAVPRPALGDFDEKAEVEESLADLRELFARHGSVRELRLVDRGDASFAYLTFDHEAEAELARRELDGLRLAGRTLRVAVAQ